MIYQYPAGQAGPRLSTRAGGHSTQSNGQPRSASVMPNKQSIPRPRAAVPTAVSYMPPSTERMGGGMAQSASQSFITPASGAQVKCATYSPAVQVRASRGHPSAHTEPPVQVIRKVPTPSRAETSQQWSVDNSYWLASEGEESRFAGRVQLLDKHLVTSVKDAIEGLNRHALPTQESYCVVFNASDSAYYLLYQANCLDAALARVGKGDDCDSSTPNSSVNGVKVSRNRVVRQSSMPTSVGGHESLEVERMRCRGSGSGGFTARVGSPTASLPDERSVEPPATANACRSGDVSAATSTPGVSGTPLLGGPRPPLRNVASGLSPAQAQSQSYLPPPVAGAPPSAPTGSVPQAPRPVSVAPRRFASPAPQRKGWQQVTHAQSYQPTRNAYGDTPPQGPAKAQHALPPPPSRAVGSGDTPKPVLEARDQKNRKPSQSQSTPRDNLERELDPVEKVEYSELQFVEHLGSGEFGQVMRGVYRGEEVAIKQLYWDNTVMTESVMQDLAKEIGSFRHLRHKRLVRFIGACLEMPHPVLVTEYMPGGSLHHLLHVRKLQLPVLHAINMCLQLADGVMYLHLQTPTIVHRDLKSLNVVLDLNLNVKICDFGLTESMERTHITKSNNGGSPRYMAPELFDAKTKITEKIDIWAVGCIFVEIFGGPLPYEQINTLAELTREMLVHKRSPFVPQLPGDLNEIVSSCLLFDHVARPGSKRLFEELKAAKKQLRDAGEL